MPFTRRTMMREAGLAGATLALTGPQALLAQARDPLWFVHPELRPMAVQLQKMFGTMPPLTRESLASERAGMSRWQRPPLAAMPFERRTVPGLAGQGDVTVYVVNARKGEGRGAILHTHGGGYVSGSAESSVRNLQELCAELGCMAVSVEYRLAPETTFAGSIEDNYAGLKWLHDNAASLGADPARIVLMGESAGGGHAALLSIAARDRGEVPVAYQCLIYPMLDDRTGSSRQVPPHVGTLIWTAGRNRFGWESFLGQTPGTRRVPARGVPARTASLAGLPPAFIGVGSIDLFHDEDVDYAQRLNAAGVPAELIVVPGAYHGFDGIGGATRIGKAFNAAKMAALRQALVG